MSPGKASTDKTLGFVTLNLAHVKLGEEDPGERPLGLGAAEGHRPGVRL